jgi:hypothetical protein
MSAAVWTAWTLFFLTLQGGLLVYMLLSVYRDKKTFKRIVSLMMEIEEERLKLWKERTDFDEERKQWKALGRDK